jgi:hypothetical protein
MNEKVRPSYSITSVRHKFNIFAFPKCGCSTLKAWFIKTEFGEDFFHNNLRLHKKYYSEGRLRLHDFIWYHRRKCRFNSSYPTYAVTRNPFSRLVSAYFDKVNKETDPQYDPRFTTFKQWALSLSKDPVVSRGYNGHWRPVNFDMETVVVDEFIQLENLQEGMDKLIERFNLPDYKFIDGKTHLRRYNKPFQSYYDKDTFEHVKAVYIDDLKLLNFYSQNYEDY